MVNIDFHNLSPAPSNPPGTVPETLTCHIYIYDHIYIEVALGQDCQMYNKLAAPYITNWQHHGSGLPYNISSSERVNILHGSISYRDPLWLGSKLLYTQTIANVLPGIVTEWVILSSGSSSISIGTINSCC